MKEKDLKIRDLEAIIERMALEKMSDNVSDWNVTNFCDDALSNLFTI